MKLSSITIPRILNATKMIVVLPVAVVARIRRPSVWIITERPDQARDNGFCFFKYLKNKHPEQEVYYIIDKKSIDYRKVSDYGNVISFNSWKHYFYFCLSKIHISAHVAGCLPSDNPFAKRTKRILQYKDVFLPHGVSYGVSEFCLSKYAKIDLFITSGRPEYENVLKNYGYTRDQVVYTGFPRLDEWHNINIKSNQILLMPTWRMYLAQNPDTDFEKTVYFNAYQELITLDELHDFLRMHDLKLIFYLHHNMQKYARSFHTEFSEIEVVYQDDIYDIQQLLKESALLITDYSSVHFDFAYMNKPVLYYQFDREEFWDKQYKQSSFDAAKDGFGPVAYGVKSLVYELKQAYANGFTMKSEYQSRMREFYQLYDDHNCDRVYREITKI